MIDRFVVGRTYVCVNNGKIITVKWAGNIVDKAHQYVANTEGTCNLLSFELWEPANEDKIVRILLTKNHKGGFNVYDANHMPDIDSDVLVDVNISNGTCKIIKGDVDL